MAFELIKWDNIRTQIETAKDFDVLSDMRDKLKAYETLAKQRGESFEVKNKVGEYLLRADRKLGQWLKENINHDGAKGKVQQHIQGLQNTTPEGKASLNDIGITKQESHIFQKMANLSEEKFEEIVQDYKQNEEVASESVMLNTIKKINREIKIKEQEEGIAKGTIKLPEGKYEVIVIDPPWNYGREYDPEGSRIANPYPEMSFEKLKEINLPSAEDSFLWLWTTHQFIWDAKKLLEHWGYEYKAIMIWNKEKMGMGAWLRMQCEFCLMGIKGKPLWKGKDVRDIIIEPRTSHSTKPEKLYEIINNNCIGRKLDYFARKKRDGWDAYGDEIN